MIGGIVNANVVVRCQDENFVDSACFGFNMNGAVMVNRKGLIAIKCRIQVWDHPCGPGATIVASLERRKRRFLVSGAKRAWPRWIGFDLGNTWSKVTRTLGALGHDGDPPPGERIETQLTHNTASLRRSCNRGADGEHILFEDWSKDLAAVHADVTTAVIIERRAIKVCPTVA